MQYDEDPFSIPLSDLDDGPPAGNTTPTVHNAHALVRMERPKDVFFTDKLGNAFLIDSSTGVHFPLPNMNKSVVNGLLGKELMALDPTTGELNIVAILQNLITMSKTKGKVGLDAANTVLDRVLGKPIQETKNLNANVNADSLEELLDMVGPKHDTQPQQPEQRPASPETCDTSADVL